jgi:hypothetical protein
MAKLTRAKSPTSLADAVALTEARVQLTGPVTLGALTDLDKPSRDNSAMSEYWSLVADIVTGAKAIRAKGELYLPKFPEENQENYDFRLKCSKFTNVYRDMIEQLSAKPFEETIKLPEGTPSQIEEFANDVDGAGNSLSVWAVTSFFNAINDAISWIFIDYTKSIPEPGRVRSIADEQAAGLRPYWTRVLASNVLEVRTALVNGSKELTFVRILEVVDSKTFVRILERQGDIVNWFLYEKKVDGVKIEWILVDAGPITIGVIPLVPIITGRRNGETWQFYPPMRDAADLQIELYQEESGLKHISQLTAFPMLAGNGIAPPRAADGKTIEKLRVGPSTVLYGPPNPGGGAAGNWSYVEPGASSLEFLQKKVDKTTESLRELGRQPLTAQSTNVTVITSAVAAGKANTAVGMWAYGLQDAIDNALMITGLWYGIRDYEAKAEVFTDFDIDGEGDDAGTLTSMRKNRDISQETYWHEMKRRGVLSGEFDPEAEKKLLLAEVPADDGSEDSNPANALPGPRKPAPAPAKA